jgi:DNA polymerase (family 10)
VAPVALDVLRDLALSNGSALLERLQEATPEGLLEMLRVPGLGPSRIRAIHDGLHVDSLQELERAARDGRLAALPKFGTKTAEKIFKGIADLRATGAYVLWPHGRAEAERIADAIRAHPDVMELAIAGAIRRRMEIVRDVDLVCAVRGIPSVVAASFAQLRGVREVLGGGGRTMSLRLEDGVRVDVSCVRPEQFALALWRATGSTAHVKQMTERAAALGLVLAGDELRDRDGALIPIADEAAFYARLGLAYVVPEQREAMGEVEAAAQGAFPALIRETDLVGALHCHSHYSDGGASIHDMATAARARGLQYLGISDHSQSNTYAGGVSRDAILRQHDEIDALNAQYAADGVAFRVLKGIEADILPCGRVDYPAAVLDRFDFVIGSVHSRYGMNERQMTDRVLKALDDPHVTILGHPTGRLLLTREPYAINLDAIIEKAGAVGVAMELNADPNRLDIDWRACRVAQEKGALVSIGPDAHSPQGLDHLELGIAHARKGWLTPSNVLNTRSAEAVLAFARARRAPEAPAPRHMMPGSA